MLVRRVSLRGLTRQRDRETEAVLEGFRLRSAYARVDIPFLELEKEPGERCRQAGVQHSQVQGRQEHGGGIPCLTALFLVGQARVSKSRQPCFDSLVR